MAITTSITMLQTDAKTGLKFILLNGDESSQQSQHPRSHVPVVCFHGSGQTGHAEDWSSFVQAASDHAPILFYERRGTQNSSRPGNQTPSDAVKDLVRLLQGLRLEPPYVLAAHSYGGTIAREFIHQRPRQVAGMVLAETGQETPTQHDEAQYRKQALGRKPLSVIHANTMGTKFSGNLTEEMGKMRDSWAAEDERLKKAQLQLSSQARYARLEDCGHHVVRDRPGVVVEEVRWVIEHLLQ